MAEEVKIFRIHIKKKDDTRFSGPIFLALQDGNILRMVWTYFNVQMNLFMVQNDICDTIWLRKFNISRRHDKRWMTLGVAGSFFEIF